MNNPHYESENYKVLSRNTDFVGINIMTNVIFVYNKNPVTKQILQDIHMRQNQVYKDFSEYIN
uniref:Uncharacterized protein n=1 Tax=Moumouvirus sp. 'Monve' TaxID=1128131 RepID=H2EEJ2_9VIRU|nr:hypothetical protein mv_L610 [Moumouvirus Monve]